MRIAFVGDIHGKLRDMYSFLDRVEAVTGARIDATIQVGDFHAIRNNEDLARFPVRKRHRELGDFPYFFQALGVPRETFFIAGNHENFLWLNKEFPNGGQILEKLTYLARSGVTKIGGARVGWVSRTYALGDFDNGRSPKHFTR